MDAGPSQAGRSYREKTLASQTSIWQRTPPKSSLSLHLCLEARLLALDPKGIATHFGAQGKFPAPFFPCNLLSPIVRKQPCSFSAYLKNLRFTWCLLASTPVECLRQGNEFGPGFLRKRDERILSPAQSVTTSLPGAESSGHWPVPHAGSGPGSRNGGYFVSGREVARL